MADVIVVLGTLAVLMAPCVLALDVSRNDRPYDGDLYELPQRQG
jgi:hypothetical protein